MACGRGRGASSAEGALHCACLALARATSSVFYGAGVKPASTVMVGLPRRAAWLSKYFCRALIPSADHPEMDDVVEAEPPVPSAWIRRLAFLFSADHPVNA